MNIVVIDTETSGLDPTQGAGLLELAAVPLLHGAEGWQPHLWRASLLAHPGPIPPETSAVHHIVPDMLVGAPERNDYLAELMVAHPAGETVWVAHNAEFDQRFLPELTGGQPWICTYRCALHLWPQAPGHSNQTLRYWLGAHPHPAIVAGLAPHRALYDAACTAAILQRMLADHSIEELQRLTTAPVLLRTVRFGRHRGAPWAEVPPSYLRWLIREGTFGPDVEHTCNHYLRSV